MKVSELIKRKNKPSVLLFNIQCGLPKLAGFHVRHLCQKQNSAGQRGFSGFGFGSVLGKRSGLSGGVKSILPGLSGLSVLPLPPPFVCAATKDNSLRNPLNNLAAPEFENRPEQSHLQRVLEMFTT